MLWTTVFLLDWKMRRGEIPSILFAGSTFTWNFFYYNFSGTVPMCYRCCCKKGVVREAWLWSMSFWVLFLALFDLATLLTSCTSLGSCCCCGCGCSGHGFKVFQYPLSCGQFQSSTFFNIGYLAYQLINKQTISAWSNSHSTVNQVQLQSNRFSVCGRPVT